MLPVSIEVLLPLAGVEPAFCAAPLAGALACGFSTAFASAFSTALGSTFSAAFGSLPFASGPFGLADETLAGVVVVTLLGSDATRSSSAATRDCSVLS